jgi:hypothetical protein
MMPPTNTEEQLKEVERRILEKLKPLVGLKADSVTRSRAIDIIRTSINNAIMMGYLYPPPPPGCDMDAFELALSQNTLAFQLSRDYWIRGRFVI